ncbi:UDP-N-acetylmuramoylalanyl-D-glutamate--2,6-diaminopimelate ligase, partial [Cupriavidus basilensis OR16]
MTGDTRRLAQGDVFFAYVLGNARLSTDGRPHIAQAIARGASAVVFEADGFAWPHEEAVPHLGVSGLHQLAGAIAAGWYGERRARSRRDWHHRHQWQDVVLP